MVEVLVLQQLVHPVVVTVEVDCTRHTLFHISCTLPPVVACTSIQTVAHALYASSLSQQQDGAILCQLADASPQQALSKNALVSEGY